MKSLKSLISQNYEVLIEDYQDFVSMMIFNKEFLELRSNPHSTTYLIHELIGFSFKSLFFLDSGVKFGPFKNYELKEIKKNDDQISSRIKMESPLLTILDKVKLEKDCLFSLHSVLFFIDSIKSPLISSDEVKILDDMYVDCEKLKIPNSTNMDLFFKISLKFFENINSKSFYHEDALQDLKILSEYIIKTRAFSLIIPFAQIASYVAGYSNSYIKYDLIDLNKRIP